MEKENAVLPQIVDSVLGAVPVVGGGLQNAYDAWRQKNINMAREVLLTNIRSGDLTAIHRDDFFSMLARFSRSVQEGVAKRNLILLARLISGMGKVEECDCKSNLFARYANMLEHLNVDELKYLASFICYYSTPEKERTPFNIDRYKLQENPIADTFVQRGIFVSDFEVWQQEHDDWKNPSQFPTDIRSERSFYLSADMQDIVDKYGVDWEKIATMDINDEQ